MNLGQAILHFRKALMYEFHYNYMLPKHGSMVKFCYTRSFVITNGYLNDDNRLLPIRNNEKVTNMMKN